MRRSDEFRGGSGKGKNKNCGEYEKVHFSFNLLKRDVERSTPALSSFIMLLISSIGVAPTEDTIQPIGLSKTRGGEGCFMEEIGWLVPG